MTGSRFDLLTERWVPVLDDSGHARELGLEQVLLRAHELRRITGETPPMTAALHRLVLALLHRAYGPPTEEDWGALWKATALPEAPLREYLADKTSRFDLFDPERPFFQCPDLARLAPSTPFKLVPHRAVGNKVTLFDHTTASDRATMTPAEAARWLVTTQAFDPGGMKTPFTKDKSSQKAPCNTMGVVLVEGATLKETLLLNTLRYRPELERPEGTWPDDHPVWEQAHPPSGEPRTSRTARGWTDLLTWPSRRVLLFHDQADGRHVVNGVVLTPGDRYDGSQADEEKMAAFRKPVGTNGKPMRDKPLLPVRLHPVRGVWRHSVELLLSDRREENRSRLRPRTLHAIPDHVAQGHIPAKAVYTLRVFGQQLDDNNSVVEAYLEDQVPAPVTLLRADDEVLGALIGTAITLADNAGAALRHMERDYRKDKRAAPSSTLDLDYWPKLTARFTTLITDLGEVWPAGAASTEAVTTWSSHVRRTAQRAAERWAGGAQAEAADIVLMAKYLDRFLNRLITLVRTFDHEVRNYIPREEE
ncbi:type I-E CRISPR-associated protein Cse1/CasA [Saccharothrix xinjiangensis]|uniref:Type I-E CRISPR-associated protein Cse1/CasA n=1 Tax=Saccharothrix xinjiangensis TaxID=204798 RepID=A0ABV9YAH9_9PSEU